MPVPSTDRALECAMYASPHKDIEERGPQNAALLSHLGVGVVPGSLCVVVGAGGVRSVRLVVGL